MYDVSTHGAMIADKIRFRTYVEALRRYVKPGSVVLDLGAGIGPFSILACQMGARRVYAIEPAAAIQVAREIARDNGCYDRIEFIQNMSTAVTLPERADVMISDLRGVLPFCWNSIGSVVDARKRLLAPNGQLIAQRDSMWAVLVEAPTIYAEFINPWEAGSYNVDFRSAQHLVLNTWKKKRTADKWLVEPICWATLDYATIEQTNVHADIHWTVEQAGIVHGLRIWFDTIVAEGLGFTNAPNAGETIYGSAFFPLLEPVQVAAGDKVSVGIYADLMGYSYVWRWETKVIRNDEPMTVLADFKQSTFIGTPTPLQQLLKRADSYVPKLSDDGKIDSYILAQMDGIASTEELAEEVRERYPNRFATADDALTRVADLVERYSS
jgi:protein arginine N-methyltransferase 1